MNTGNSVRPTGIEKPIFVKSCFKNNNLYISTGIVAVDLSMNAESPLIRKELILSLSY